MLQPATESSPARPDPVASIPEPYLLVLNIPCYAGSDGRRVVDPLWHKDLARHLDYLERLTLAAPRSADEPPAGGLAILASQGGGRLDHVDLSCPRSFGSALLHLPADLTRLWRAIGRAKLVHTGVAGWPIPLGWIAAPLARLRRRVLIVVVESAPWRPQPGGARAMGSLRRLRAAVWEGLARWCVGLSEVAFFTQEEYRKSLLGDDPRGHVVPASWIDEQHILTDREADERWRARLGAPDGPLRLVYAGRLVADKGVPTLLESMQLLDRLGVGVVLDVFGAGPLQAECARVAASLRGGVEIRLCGTLPYDRSFFDALAPHHGMVVPSLSDEQPRIAFDAFSQALPVLGSDTAGLRQCVTDGIDGMLASPGDAAALSEVIRRASQDRERLRELGLAGLVTARGLTHQEMHRRRSRILAEVLQSKSAGRRPTDRRSGRPEPGRMPATARQESSESSPRSTSTPG